MLIILWVVSTLLLHANITTPSVERLIISDLIIPVGQQYSPTDVTENPYEVTRFKLAKNIALLAHSQNIGKQFVELEINSPLYILYSDGRIIKYQIVRIELYQALSPESPYSNFLSESNELLSSTELFNHIYTTPNQVVLQTCFEKDNNPFWGRIFIIAEKLVLDRKTH